MSENPIEETAQGEEATGGIVIPRRALALGLAALAIPAKVFAQAAATPFPNTQEKPTMADSHSPTGPAHLLRRNLLEIFNEYDEAKRRKVFAEIWAPDGVFYEPRAIHRGVEAINGAVAGLQKGAWPTARFSITTKPQSSYDLGRLEWAFGAADGRGDIYHGTNIGLVRDGKLVRLDVFMDIQFPQRPAGAAAGH